MSSCLQSLHDNEKVGRPANQTESEQVEGQETDERPCNVLERLGVPRGEKLYKRQDQQLQTLLC